MIEIFMLLIYAALFIIALIIATKALKTEWGRVSRRKFNVRATFTRLFLIARVSMVFLKTPAVLLAVAMLIISMFISANAAQYSLSETEFRVSPINGEALYVSFDEAKELVSVNDTIVSFLGKEYISSIKPYYRIILTQPLLLNNWDILAVIGAPPDMLNEWGLNPGNFYIGCNVSGSIMGYLNNIQVICIHEDLLINEAIVDDVPLLPIQAYLGTKPITVPPTHSILTDLHTATQFFEGRNEVMITDIVVILVGDPPELRGNLSKLSETLGGVVWYISNDSVIVVGGAGIPTMQSLLIALISAAVSSVVIISIYSSLRPRIKELYDKLSLVGLPPWGMGIIIIFIILSSSIISGIPTLVIISNVYSGTSTLNAFITFIISISSVLVYLKKSVKLASLKTDVVTPVMPRLTMVVRDADPMELLTYLANLIKTNEFFITEDVEIKSYNNEAILHASMQYVETWGSGVDVTIIATKQKDESTLYITSNPWSVEEFSESIVKTMQSLAVARLVGGVKIWQLRHLR